MSQGQCVSTLKKILLGSVAIIAPQYAFAQDTGSAAGVETVVVTGSLISRPDFKAPTPVASINAEDLTKTAPNNLGDVLDKLPQFGVGASAYGGFNGGNGGAIFVNLRNLGLNRTLILVNGERVVAANLTGNVDLNLLPTGLLKRVDVVTGGASASYGSDAVAGVVNLILDNNFTGIKGNAQYSNNGENTYEGYSAGLSGGTDFDGGKGHVVASVSYFDNPQFYTLGQAPWNKGTVLLPNPSYTATNGQPKLIHVDNVGLGFATRGGVITAGPLANTQFVGPNAVPTPFRPGLIGGISSGLGDGDTSTIHSVPVGQPQHSFNFYTYASYKLAPNLNAHLSLDYGSSGGASASTPYIANGTIPISIDNPYIPAQTRAQMVASGITSFKLGTTNTGLASAKTGTIYYPSDRAQVRAEAGLDGAFGDNWSWNAYFGHGETHYIERWIGDPYLPNYNLAVDAVVAPVGNAAGIAPGTVACRSTLTNPSNGCVPIDIFGTVPVSTGALNYIDQPQWTQVNNKQDVASLSLQGEPISNWAGAVSLAGGASYRSESAVSYSNPLAYTRGFQAGNNLAFHGAVNVWEGFLETLVPLARDEFWAQSMDFDAAGRVTDYSTSGVVESWKLGVTNQVSDDYRLRATWSADIRAPNMSELFTAATSGTRSIADPFNPGSIPQVLATQTGNPTLKPETASTVTGGIVFTPTWLPGLSASIDWYSINLKGAIASISAENEIAYCFAGVQSFCGLVHRNAAGALTEIVSRPANTAAATTSGVDVTAEYVHDLYGGSLDLNLTANYTDETTITQNNTVIDNAGSVSGDTVGGAGVPKFKATIGGTFSEGPYSGTIQTRLLSSARLVNTWTSLNVDNNDVPWVAYLDVRGSFNLNPNWQLYFAVDNVLDIPPPNTPESYLQGNQYYTPESSGNIYDVLGRQYRVGVRVKF